MVGQSAMIGAPLLLGEVCCSARQGGGASENWRYSYHRQRRGRDPKRCNSLLVPQLQWLIQWLASCSVAMVDTMVG